MIKRQISKKVNQLVKKYPVLTITGPRQTGKTTLVRSLFKDYAYVNLENPERRRLALNDPQGFINHYNSFTIIDEIQYAPDLLSFIQEKVDNERIPGQYIITGSQSFSMLERVTQSLAGRTAILKLLPLTYHEVSNFYRNSFNPSYAELIFNGLFPGKYQMDIASVDFYQSYFETYIQRDVRQIKNIVNLEQFSNFVRLCAGRIGQILDLSSIAGDVGVSVNTVKGWLSVLQASYIIVLLQPYYKNLNKRLIKSPKLYFTDTGLASFLLNITNTTQVESHYLKGGLFENYVLLELLKNRYNNGLLQNIYFYRDSNHNEIDFLIERHNGIYAIEVKSGQTFSDSFLKPLNFWNKNFLNIKSDTFLVYGGEVSQKYKNINIVSWKGLSILFND